jgi:thioredoxin reductase
MFRIDTADGEVYECEVLLCALGTVAPFVPTEIEGIELAIGYEDMTLDPDAYRGKRVAVIGQGN